MTDTLETVKSPVTYERYSDADLRARGLFREPTDEELEEFRKIPGNSYRSHNLDACVLCGKLVRRHRGRRNHGDAHERHGEAESYNRSLYGRQIVWLRKPNAEELEAWERMTAESLKRLDARHAAEYEVEETRAAVLEEAARLVDTIQTIAPSFARDLQRRVEAMRAAEQALAALEREQEPDEPEPELGDDE